MPAYSNGSALKLSTCHTDLQRLMNEVIKHVDVAITCGHRNKEEQDKVFDEWKSKLRFPHSKHNSLPALALDFVPFVNGKPVWNNAGQITAIAFFIKGIAAAQGIKVRLGADWNGDFDTKTDSFLDAFHVELE